MSASWPGLTLFVPVPRPVHRAVLIAVENAFEGRGVVARHKGQRFARGFKLLDFELKICGKCASVSRGIFYVLDSLFAE
jgi:hypothetical protein